MRKRYPLLILGLLFSLFILVFPLQGQEQHGLLRL